MAISVSLLIKPVAASTIPRSRSLPCIARSLASPRGGWARWQVKEQLTELGIGEYDYDGGVPLLALLALTGWAEGCELLLEYGADVTATGPGVWQPLSCSCRVRNRIHRGTAMQKWRIVT